MKKIGLFLFVLVTLLTVSCSNILVSDKDGGSVSLVIDAATAQSVRSALLARNATVEGLREVTARLVGDYQASESKTVSANALAGTSFTFEKVPVGKEIRLLLEVKNGASLIWYGSSGFHRVKSGTNSLQLVLGRVSGVVLWKRNDDSSSMSVSIAPYGNYGSLQSLGEVSQDPPVWCFDNTGNIYWYGQGQNGAQRYDLQPDGSYISSGVYYNSPPFYALSFDNSTNTLYGIGDGGSLKYWQKDGGAASDISGSTVDSASCLGFAVHNNVAYVAETGLSEGDNGEIVVSLSRYNLSSGGSQKIGDTIGHQLPTVFGTDASTLTGQMICQDGALYLSIGRVDFSSGSAGYSVGAVIKINAETLAIESSFGENGYLGLLTSSTMINEKECYAPTEENDNAYFYGPLGFVAVMPKKLVIADSGFAMSDGSGQVNLSKKRRIVTVDLETEAFSSVAVEDYYDPTYTTASGFDVVN